MKDNSDKGTQDMFGVKRGRGRPKTGTAKSGAERQTTYRAKQQENYVTVTINKALLQRLEEQLQAIRENKATLALTPNQASEIISAIQHATKKKKSAVI